VEEKGGEGLSSASVAREERGERREERGELRVKTPMECFA